MVSLLDLVKICAVTMCLNCASAYKILIMVPIPIKSHYHLGKGIADILHERGHQVTFVGCFASKEDTYREIDLPELKQMKENNSIVGFDMSQQGKMHIIRIFNTWIPLLIDTVMENPDVRNLLNEQFDLVILSYNLNEAMIGLGVKFNCPVILLTTISKMPWLVHLTGNPAMYASVPNAFHSFGSRMSLIQRAQNLVTGILYELLWWLVLIPKQRAVYLKHFPEEASRVPFEDLKMKVAMTFINSHPSVELARPLLPNTIEIGGYYIKEPKPLPDDLKDILDRAKHGVIFFSLGSNIKSSSMPPDMRTGILKALARVNQTVIWKFETDIPEKSANVIIRKWVPQTGVLAHPNVKLFISHGGQLSCTETSAAGVPMLVIPIFGDQFHNSRVRQERGQGVFVDIQNVTEESLTWALNEVLNNPVYEQNAKRIKLLYHDRIVSPRELVSFYSEFVVRSGGAAHLSLPNLDRYQVLLVDVAALIFAPILLLILMCVYLCKKICRRSRTANDHNSGRKKQN